MKSWLAMLTDKQNFLCCGLLSLAFHLVAVGMYFTKGQTLPQNSKPAAATIQVTLIDVRKAAIEMPAEKKIPKERHRPEVKQPIPVVASKLTGPKNILLSEPIKEEPRRVAEQLPLHYEIFQQKPEEQQQSFEPPPPPVQVAVVSPVKTFKQQTGSEGLNDYTSIIEQHSGEEKSVASSNPKEVPAVASERWGEGDSFEDQDQALDPVYLGYIRGMIEKHIAYPARARRLRMTGKVNLSFMITATGAIDEIRILAESPYPILNKAAILAVKLAAPFPQPKRNINVELPILFSLKRS
ncbi:MAG: energy transducer TonB [Desulfuromusa sp.]